MRPFWTFQLPSRQPRHHPCQQRLRQVRHRDPSRRGRGWRASSMGAFSRQLLGSAVRDPGGVVVCDIENTCAIVWNALAVGCGAVRLGLLTLVATAVAVPSAEDRQ